MLNQKGFSLVSALAGALIVAFIGGGVFYFSKQQNQPILLPAGSPQSSPQSSLSPKPSASPAVNASPSVQPTLSNNQTYQVPSNWQKYSDSESGISIYYPPQYTAKYNSNRGFGTNYSAGSYLLDASGKKVLDFFKFPYNGGSRRQAFYEAVEFDGPENMSQYTVSVADVVLNGNTYLKLTSSYLAKSGREGNRTFFLIPQGNQIYYFTHPASLENNSADYKNILTVIATSTLTASTGTSSNQYISCYVRPSDKDINNAWEARIENGDMVVTQRTNKALKEQAVDKTKISISGNPQNSTYKYFNVTDFDVYIDSAKKGSFPGAFTIKIKKSEVDKILQNTPASVASVAIVTSISGGIETVDGESCKADLLGYYAPKL